MSASEKHPRDWMEGVNLKVDHYLRAEFRGKWMIYFTGLKPTQDCAAIAGQWVAARGGKNGTSDMTHIELPVSKIFGRFIYLEDLATLDGRNEVNAKIQDGYDAILSLIGKADAAD